MSGGRRNAKVVLLMGVVFGGAFSLFLQTSYASAASLTLTVPGAIKLEINPGAAATFSKSSASSIGVKTDAAFGYDLSIKVKDGANGNSLVNGSNKLSSISANLSEESYKAAGNDNTWGYLPSKVNSSDNTEFLPGPTTSLTTIEKTSAKNDTDNNYSVTLAAKVDQTIPTGNYTNTFVFTAAANTVSYSITYDLNSGSGGPSSNPQTGTTSNGTIKLDSTAPTREGYEFKGWCTVSTSDENCSGTTYQPGADYPLKSGSNSVTLWAMWKSAVPTTMQGFGDYCNKMSTNQTMTLRDVRDNSSYTVAKLKDGKCWMTQNLAIGGDIPLTLNSSTSDLNDDFVLPSSMYSDPTWKHDNLQASRIYIKPDYGGFYTWFAATAGDDDITSDNHNAQHSICPKGWKLPIRDDVSSLESSYSLSQIQSSPANFKMTTGFCHNGDCSYAGTSQSQGRYWSATGNKTCARVIAIQESIYPRPDYCDTKGYGFAVRCLSR